MSLGVMIPDYSSHLIPLLVKTAAGALLIIFGYDYLEDWSSSGFENTQHLTVAIRCFFFGYLLKAIKMKTRKAEIVAYQEVGRVD